MSSNLIFGTTKRSVVRLVRSRSAKSRYIGSIPILTSKNKHECSSAVEHWSPKPGVGISEFSTRAKSPNSSTNRTGSYGLPDRGLIPLSDSNIQYMVVVAQSVERRFVEPEVAGAEPVNHPSGELIWPAPNLVLKTSGTFVVWGSTPQLSAK